MKLKKNKKIFTLLVIVIIVLVVVAGYIYRPYWWLSKEERLLYSGYCPEIGRALTDQEKCNIAVQAIIDKKNSHISDFYFTTNDAGEEIRTEILIKKYDYSSMEEFYAMNPNSCKFVEVFKDEGQIFTIPLKEKMNGRLNTFINVSYFFAFDEQNDNKPIIMMDSFGLSNCGRLLTRIDLLNFYLFGKKLKR